MPTDLYVNKVMKWREEGIQGYPNENHPLAFKGDNQSDRFCLVCKRAIVGSAVDIDLPDGVAVQAHERCLELLAKELQERGVLDIPKEKPHDNQQPNQDQAAQQLKVGKPRPEMRVKAAPKPAKVTYENASPDAWAMLLNMAARGDVITLPDGTPVRFEGQKDVTALQKGYARKLGEAYGPDVEAAYLDGLRESPVQGVKQAHGAIKGSYMQKHFE